MLAVVRSTRLFPQPHGTIHNTRMLFPRCLFAHLKQTLLELKLPVVPRAGAGSLLRPPAPQEDALCSERSGANLRQHQRAVRCFSNLTSNEKRASCTDAITAASLGGGEPALQDGTVEPSPLGAHRRRRAPEMWSVSDE